MTTTAIDGDTDTARHTQRVQAALDAYNDGKGWEGAAAAAGYTNRGTAYAAVMRSLGREVSESVATLRAEANARHASKIAVLEDVIYDLEQPLDRRLRALDVHTRAEARHAALNGLNAPVQIALSVGAAAMMADALSELETIVMGSVTARSDDLDPGDEDGTDLDG